MIEPIPYGVIEFEFKSLHEGQQFWKKSNVEHMHLLFDAKGKIHLSRYGSEPPGTNEWQKEIGSYAFGEWQKMRILFSVGDGWRRIWRNQECLGRFDAEPGGLGTATLRFVSRQTQAGSNTVSLLRAVRVTRIDPIGYSPGGPLSWSICGPFGAGTDGLTPMGGAANASPYPGLEIPDEEGNTRRFLPFVKTDKANNHVIDLTNVPGLLPKNSQGNARCYAVCYVVSAYDKEVALNASSEGAYALWVNHELVSRSNTQPLGKCMVKLREGLNTILIEVDQGDGAFRFGVALK